LTSWEESIKKHYGAERPSETRSQYRNEEFWSRGNIEWDIYSALRDIQVRECLYAQYDSWKEAYKHHENRVKSFFADRDGSRFLEVDIISDDGWEEICDFLGKEVPDQTFPHKHKTSNRKG
jgi:hypothetical protein